MGGSGSRSYVLFLEELDTTARKRSCRKVMFLHLSVSHSVRGGVFLAETSPERDAPPVRKERAVRILLECILVLEIGLQKSLSFINSIFMVIMYTTFRYL